MITRLFDLEAPIRLLLVEDDRDSGDALKHMLERRGVSVLLVPNAEEGLRRFESEPFDAVVADIRLENLSGVDLLQEIRQRNTDFPVILLTGFDSLETAMAAVKHGANDYLLKPLEDVDVLLVPVRKAVRHCRLVLHHRALEEELRLSEARFRGLFDSMSSGVAVYEPTEDGRDFVIRDFNRAAERIEGVKKEDIIGQRVTEAFPGVMPFGLIEVFQRVRATGTPEHHPPALYADERIRGWRENHVYKLPTGEVVAVYDDVTERIGLEDLRIAKQAAEHANEAKSSFLAMVSHELRTPLQAVFGFSDALASGDYGPLSESQQAAVAGIVSSGGHLRQVIDDLLDMSKIEAGRIEIELNDATLVPMIEDSLTAVREIARKGKLSLGMVVGEGVNGAVVRTDRQRFHQIMLNLLSNAIKFTPSGGHVGVEAGLETAGGQEPTFARVTVADTGIGIRPEDRERVFERFVQAKRSRAHRREGLGLGLALVTEFVRLLGGEVWVESEGEGKGSAFTFTVPLAREDLAEIPRPSEAGSG